MSDFGQQEPLRKHLFPIHKRQYFIAAVREPLKTHKLIRRSRKALVITDTELKLMAAAAIMGDSSRPKTGYSTPAATGTPRAL